MLQHNCQYFKDFWSWVWLAFFFRLAYKRGVWGSKAIAGAGERGRKVRTPQGRMPGNARWG